MVRSRVGARGELIATYRASFGLRAPSIRVPRSEGASWAPRERLVSASWQGTPRDRGCGFDRVKPAHPCFGASASASASAIASVSSSAPMIRREFCYSILNYSSGLEPYWCRCRSVGQHRSPKSATHLMFDSAMTSTLIKQYFGRGA